MSHSHLLPPRLNERDGELGEEVEEGVSQQPCLGDPAWRRARQHLALSWSASPTEDPCPR
jgi:hypothetical protein